MQLSQKDTLSEQLMEKSRDICKNYKENENPPVNSGNNHAIKKDKVVLVGDSMLNNIDSCGLSKSHSK